VAVVSFNLQTLGYDRARAEQFYGELLRRARGLPSVERAALADFVPMGGRGGTMTVANPRSILPSGQDQVSAAYNRVSDDYFATVGQPVIRGRAFTPQDRPGAPLVAIVNEAMARRFWPREDAVGKRIRIVSEAGDVGIVRQVVGVAKDAQYGSFGGEIGPFVFMPAPEGFGRLQTLHIRAANPAAVLAEINGLVRDIDSNVVPQSSRTMREAMSFALVPTQIVQTVLGVAGAIALLLATGGLYGLVCYTLEQRFKEIGIRVALGASREKVFRLIVGGTVRLTAIGVVVGMLLAAGAMRLLSSLLIGLSSNDPLTFMGVGALMVVITLGAGYIAARKGLSVNPVAVLKYE
jgi:predicted permease